jgi:hypothetical protein
MQPGPPPHVQLPPMQPSPRMPHASPQPPQLLRSVCVFTHVEPPQHSCAAPHVRPHAPQFATVSTRVQVPLQHIWPEGQLPPQGRLLTHRPAVHRSSVPHGRSQPPQCIAFVCVSTQPEPQQVFAPVQAAPAPHRHVPPMHVSPVSHAGMHVAPPHVPPLHSMPMGHRLPQRPQWFGFVSVFTQLVPQHSSVSPQAGMHVAPASVVGGVYASRLGGMEASGVAGEGASRPASRVVGSGGVPCAQPAARHTRNSDSAPGVTSQRTRAIERSFMDDSEARRGRRNGSRPARGAR